MKDYKCYIDLDNTEDLLHKLMELDSVIFVIEGALNDTYLINTEHLQGSHKLGRVKFRKYMILGHEFASEYHNHLYMQLTDNDKVFDKWYQEYEEQFEGEDDDEF